MAIFDKLKRKSNDDDFMNLPTEGIGAPTGAFGPAAGDNAQLASRQLPSQPALPPQTSASASAQMQLNNKIELLISKVDSLISEIEVLKQRIAELQRRLGSQPTQQPQQQAYGYGQQQDTASAFGAFQTQQQQPQQQSPW